MSPEPPPAASPREASIAGEDARRLRDTVGWNGGDQPATGKGAEPDGELKDAAAPKDPATRSAIPGFTGEADATERAIEGDAAATALDAREDLPRQG